MHGSRTALRRDAQVLGRPGDGTGSNSGRSRTSDQTYQLIT